MNAPLQIPAQMVDNPALDPDFPWPPTNLPETDDIPLESDWHRLEINLLVDSVHYHRRPRNDYYVAGNMFVYYSNEQVRNQDFRGPDFFLVDGVSPHLRRYWAIWDEGGRYPDASIELMSPTTKNVDLTTKKELYEQRFRSPEYFAYDPDEAQLLGWRMGENGHVSIAPGMNGWLWSNQLGLWLGKWHGTYMNQTATWLRFYDTAGHLVLTLAEAKEIEAGSERQHADAARQLAEHERQRAEAERQRAEAERQRADAAEAEIARLKALLEGKS